MDFWQDCPDTGHWQEGHYKQLDACTSFAEMVIIAKSVIAHLAGGRNGQIVQICGPMTTGGLGSFDLNCRLFKNAIVVARKSGLHVFNQLPFQTAMLKIIHVKPKNGRYPVEILDEFYEPVFRSGLIHRALFIPKWETSTGSLWERKTLTRIGIPIGEYPYQWYKEALALSGLQAA